MITFVLFLVAFVFLMVAIDALLNGYVFRAIIAGAFCIMIGGAWMERAFAPTPPPTEAELAVKAKIQADEDALKIPTVLSSADGCIVYKFKDNYYWHYFTKCEKDVTTDSSRSVRSGKSTRIETETIVTQR